MSAPDCNDGSLDQLHQVLIALAKSLGVNPDAPDVVVQFAAALLLVIPSLLSHGQSRSPTKSRRRPWRAGLYEELYRDVNQTKARLNGSTKDAIADLRKDKSGPWWTHTQQSLEPRYRESRDWMRDRIARLLVQQAAPSQA